MLKEFDNYGKLYNGDCLEILKEIPSGSVDLILADLPYGTTSNKFDVIIPFKPLWEQYLRVTKENAAMVFTAQTPFDKVLAMSNLDMLRYEWIWEKTKCSGFMNAKKMPLKQHENILVFYRKLPTYNPQGLITNLKIKTGRSRKGNDRNYGKTGCGDPEYIQTQGNYPKSVLHFANPSNKGHLHPNQKPVPLMEYLINTYSNEGDVVLDNASGSGTLGIAAINTNRRFIMIEKEEEYFIKSRNRIEQHIKTPEE